MQGYFFYNFWKRSHFLATLVLHSSQFSLGSLSETKELLRGLTRYDDTRKQVWSSRNISSNSKTGTAVKKVQHAGQMSCS